MPIWVGTSGWAYAAWRPGFYPPDLAAKNFLRFYATQLNAVEVNYSFRRMLNERILATWLEQTPRNFRFAVKAHQAITHFRRLRNAEVPMTRFVESVQPLAQAKRLAPVLFQLPPNLKADAGLLKEFAVSLPPGLRAAMEFRHESWFRDETYAILRRSKIALCVAETEDFQTPEVFTAKFAYFRLRKSNYSAPARKKIAEKMRGFTDQGREVYAFFKHEERPESPLWARELYRRVGDTAERTHERK